MGEVRVDERQMSCTRGSHKMTLVMQASHDTFVVTGEKAEAEMAMEEAVAVEEAEDSVEKAVTREEAVAVENAVAVAEGAEESSAAG